MLTNAIEAAAAPMAPPENNKLNTEVGFGTNLRRISNITSNPMDCHILRGADVIAVTNNATRALVFAFLGAASYCAVENIFGSGHNVPHESAFAAAGFTARLGAMSGAIDLYRYYTERADNRGQLLMLAAEARRQCAEEGEVSEPLLRQMIDRMSMMTETEMRSIGV